MNAADMTTSPMATIDRLVRATNDHDLERLVDCFEPGYRNETPAHPARGFTGRDQGDVRVPATLPPGVGGARLRRAGPGDAEVGGPRRQRQSGRRCQDRRGRRCADVRDGRGAGSRHGAVPDEGGGREHFVRERCSVDGRPGIRISRALSGAVTPLRRKVCSSHGFRAGRKSDEFRDRDRDRRRRRRGGGGARSVGPRTCRRGCRSAEPDPERAGRDLPARQGNRWHGNCGQRPTTPAARCPSGACRQPFAHRIGPGSAGPRRVDHG